MIRIRIIIIRIIQTFQFHLMQEAAIVPRRPSNRPATLYRFLLLQLAEFVSGDIRSLNRVSSLVGTIWIDFHVTIRGPSTTPLTL